MIVMQGASVPPSTLQMTFTHTHAPEPLALQHMAADHTCNAPVVALNEVRFI